MSFTARRKLYESAPLWVRRLIGTLPFGLVAGESYRNVVRRGPRFERATPEEQHAYQELELGELLLFVTEQVPAYRRFRDVVERHSAFDALSEFPLLDKATLQENMPDHLPQNLGQIPHYEITTGGTSGRQLRFYVDDDSQSVETAFIHRIWGIVGFSPRDRRATFRGVSFSHLPEGVYWQENPIYNEFQFSPFHMSERNLGAYVDELIRYRPRFLHGYPSAINTLAEYVLRHDLTETLPPMRAAFLASEGTTPDQRERIEKAFRLRAFSFYGHSERLILGTECEKTSVYHHVPDYGILEIVAEDGRPCIEDGERGELVGTGLLNRSLPFIRYRTGDRGRRRARECECGRAWERFDEVEGRWEQDMLEGRTGAPISLAALNMHGDLFERVARYQYRQTEPGRVALRVVAAPDFSPADAEAIERAYSDKVGDELDVSVEVVKDIPLTSRGKLRRLVKE